MPNTVLHRGRVRWEDGTPVPGALVAVASGTAPTPEVALRTNAAGEFGIALPAGTFSIEAHGPAGAKGSPTDANQQQQQPVPPQQTGRTGPASPNWNQTMLGGLAGFILGSMFGGGRGFFGGRDFDGGDFDGGGFGGGDFGGGDFGGGDSGGGDSGG